MICSKVKFIYVKSIKNWFNGLKINSIIYLNITKFIGILLVLAYSKNTTDGNRMEWKNAK